MTAASVGSEAWHQEWTVMYRRYRRRRRMLLIALVVSGFGLFVYASHLNDTWWWYTLHVLDQNKPGYALSAHKGKLACEQERLRSAKALDGIVTHEWRGGPPRTYTHTTAGLLSVLRCVPRPRLESYPDYSSHPRQRRRAPGVDSDVSALPAGAPDDIGGRRAHPRRVLRPDKAAVVHVVPQGSQRVARARARSASGSARL